MNKGQKLLKKAKKKLFLEEISYYQKELRYLLPISGPHILKKLRVVKYGTLVEKNITILLVWVLQHVCLGMQIIMSIQK